MGVVLCGKMTPFPLSTGADTISLRVSMAVPLFPPCTGGRMSGKQNSENVEQWNNHIDLDIIDLYSSYRIRLTQTSIIYVQQRYSFDECANTVVQTPINTVVTGTVDE